MTRADDACPPAELFARLEAGGPKRILTLDGGGVRGILTLGLLERIETILRDRYSAREYVLADYFDLIAGTSTGAIIAAALALGYSVAQISTLYDDLATRIFEKPLFRLGLLVPKFGRHMLQEALKRAYGESTTLGSEKLKTGLLIMTKRMDSGSPWPLTNHPADPYYRPIPGKKRIGNSNLLLWQVVRASTAAPHYFRPERLAVGSYVDPASGDVLVDEGEFVDGGMSTANNPSLQALKVATLSGFRFNWPIGEDRILLVSLGTGLRSRYRGRATGFKATAGAFAAAALLSIMDDCNREVETVMQWLSDGPTNRRIDGQISDLKGDLLAGHPLISYRRYNVLFESGWLAAQLNVSRSQEALDELSEMDRPEHMPALAELGQLAGSRLVSPDHFPAQFDRMF